MKIKPKLKIRNVHDVAAYRLCTGCGACISFCPEHRIKLVNVEDDGIRPMVIPGNCRGCDICLRVCPGINTSVGPEKVSGKYVREPDEKKWGRYIELWEGYASDTEIRFKGSSGGLCTALSLFCLENGIAGGVLHIGSDPSKPWINKTFRSTAREELLSRTGSRYSPASPCDGLKQIESAPDASVFVGKPCDIAGLKMAQELRPELKNKTALAIGFFCAGTPSTKGTIDFLKKENIHDTENITELRYRGMGWPGQATVTLKNPDKMPLKFSYEESWGFMQKYRPFRCYLCPDLTAEFADISVGDPWYREIDGREPGRSLILIRSEKGRNIIRKAIQKGYVTAEKADPEIIHRSQKNLLGKRRAIWGRILAMKITGIPFPNLDGFYLFDNWMELQPREKLKSVAGTLKRIFQRNYFKPLEYENRNGRWCCGEEKGRY